MTEKAKNSKSTREQLKSANDRFKDSLESQLGDLKNNVDKVGKNALIVGGGLLAAYLVSTLFDSGGGKKSKKKKSKSKEKAPSVGKESLLGATLKEQAIVFMLGLAAERLTNFLIELDEKDDEKSK